MPHEDWHKKPILAEILKEAILKESVEEVVSLNEKTDQYIGWIEEKEEMYDEYHMKLMQIKADIELLKEWWEKTEEDREKRKKAIKAAMTAKKSGETTEKSSTIGMSLNPVLAAIKYAVKLLIDLLKSEIKHLVDVVAVLEPSKNEFISFSGGTQTITSPNGSRSMTDVKGTFFEKIEQMELRLEKKKQLRELRLEKLKKKRLARLGGIKNRLKEQGQELADSARDMATDLTQTTGDETREYTTSQ